MYKDINNPLLKCSFLYTTTLIEYLFKKQALQTLGKGQRTSKVLCICIHTEILGYWKCYTFFFQISSVAFLNTVNLVQRLGQKQASIWYIPHKFIFLFLCRSTSFHAIKKNIYHTFTYISVPQIIHAKSESRWESDGPIPTYGGPMTTENTVHCSGKERRSRNASYFSVKICLHCLKVPIYLNIRYMKNRNFELILTQWST